MGKHDPTTISDKIYDNYISLVEEDTLFEDYNKIESMYPLLKSNGLAVCIKGGSYKFYKNVTTYDIGSLFITKYNKSLKKFRHTQEKGEYGAEGNISIKNPEEIVKLKRGGLDEGRYYAQLDKSDYAIFDVKIDPEDSPDVVVTLYIIGKKYRKYLDEYNELKAKYTKIVEDTYPEITIRHLGGGITNGQDSNFKSIDGIIFSNKDKVLRYVDNWYKNIPEYYRKYNIIPKLSIMIYGPPGTGKSSFATAIAKYFGIRTIDSYDPTYFSGDLSVKREGRRRGENGAQGICVLDDIDCICKSREEDNSQANMTTLSSLLSFLDNPPVINIKAKDNVSYPVSILIATTNYYDKLDLAIKRAGRFDYTFVMEEFNRDEAIEYCKIYNIDLDSVVPDANKKGFKIVPAELQAICLANLDSSMKQM